MSRDKGARGEREVVKLFKAAGFTARRTAQLQTFRANGAADVAVEELPLVHAEVKRDERLSVDAMCRQAETDAPANRVPVVLWRRNGGRWRVVVPVDYWLHLEQASLQLEQVISG